MNTTRLVTRTAAIFAALAIAGISVAVSAQFVVDALDRTLMIAIGATIFGAGLAFFLTRICALIEKDSG